MFRGRFVHTMDAKGRLSIPTGFRTEIQRLSKLTPILTIWRNCLALFPQETWEVIEKRLSEASTFQTDAQRMQRYYISGAIECPIDNQGRILIPAYLRDEAKLQREITLAGVGTRIEIWDKTRFDEDLDLTKKSFDKILRDNADLGI